MKLNFKCSTSGEGYWSTAKRTVLMTDIEFVSGFKSRCGYYFGDAHVYFNVRDWSTSKLGLIYSDPLWILEFKRQLLETSLITEEQLKGLHYSEQGLQGGRYVGLELVQPFFKSEFAKIITAEYDAAKKLKG